MWPSTPSKNPIILLTFQFLLAIHQMTRFITYTIIINHIMHSSFEFKKGDTCNANLYINRSCINTNNCPTSHTLSI